MTSLQEDWLVRAILAVHSYRQMYVLACEIAGKTENKTVREAAEQVVARLNSIIDLPVADGRELAVALREFLKLIAELHTEANRSVQFAERCGTACASSTANL
jgi:hypothetical protein